MIGHKEVLWIVQVGIESVLNTVDDSWLEINEDRPWNVMLIISLIEEHIFTIVAISCIFFKDALTTNAMFKTQLLPKFVADCKQEIKDKVKCCDM